MTVPMKTPAAGEIMESVLIKGDLDKLTPQERTQYYMEVCKSVGLNPLTKPFEYIKLNGKLTLYALRACTDQLRKVNRISLEIVSRDVADDIMTVHVRAKTPDGRVDEDLGSVPFPSTLKGEARSNAELKCVTKAKRRATLSICGLGWLDETEIDSIPASAKQPAPPAANVMLPLGHDNYDDETGEVIDHSPPTNGEPTAASQPVPPAPSKHSHDTQQGGTGEAPAPTMDLLLKWDEKLTSAAREGTGALESLWLNDVPPELKKALKAGLERRHKPVARGVDKASPPA